MLKRIGAIKVRQLVSFGVYLIGVFLFTFATQKPLVLFINSLHVLRETLPTASVYSMPAVAPLNTTLGLVCLGIFGLTFMFMGIELMNLRKKPVVLAVTPFLLGLLLMCIK